MNYHFQTAQTLLFVDIRPCFLVLQHPMSPLSFLIIIQLKLDHGIVIMVKRVNVSMSYYWKKQYPWNKIHNIQNVGSPGGSHESLGRVGSLQGNPRLEYLCILFHVFRFLLLYHTCTPKHACLLKFSEILVKIYQKPIKISRPVEYSSLYSRGLSSTDLASSVV